MTHRVLLHSLEPTFVSFFSRNKEAFENDSRIFHELNYCAFCFWVGPPGRFLRGFSFERKGSKQKTQFLKLWVDVCVDVFLATLEHLCSGKKPHQRATKRRGTVMSLRVDGWILLT